jgi:hypothetical protein
VLFAEKIYTKKAMEIRQLGIYGHSYLVIEALWLSEKGMVITMTITQFITAKAESAGFKTDALARKCRVGQATMYRYIRGEYRMPPAVEKTVGRVLGLSAEEKREFKSIIAQSIQLKPMMKAFSILDTMVFRRKTAKIDYQLEENVIFLENDRLLFTIEEARERMLMHVGAPNYRCSLRVLGDYGKLNMQRIVSFIDKLFNDIEDVTVEHFIPISTKDYADSVQVLISVLPLLKHNGYKMFYSDTDNKDRVHGLLAHSFYFSSSFDDENGNPHRESFLVALRESGADAYLCLNNPYMHEFITNEFFDLRRVYKKNFLEERSSGHGLNFVASMEQKYPLICMKSEFAMVRIPVEAYVSTLKRIGLNELHEVAEGFAEQPVQPEMVDEVLKKFVAKTDARQRASYFHQHTDVVCREGLLKFVETGRIYCDYNWSPPFNKEELLYILKYVRDRNMDENDSYNLYITEKPILGNGYHIFVYKDMGVLFYSATPPRVHTSNSMCVESHWLANLFTEYAESYIPAHQALSKEETTAYLNSLIDKYLN